MPTYTVKYSNLKIKEKKKIAKIITSTHSKITGANNFFAQVIFEKNSIKSHFMGGKKVQTPEIFVNGQIRSGRSKFIKKKLILAIRNNLLKVINIKVENIWIYLTEINPDQMIEYGHILPKSGHEKSWFKSLTKKLRERLIKLDN